MLQNFDLKRLSSSDSASLLAKLTSHRWRSADIKDNIKIMSLMKNNPLEIHRLATLQNQFQFKTLSKLVDSKQFQAKLEKKEGPNMVNGAHSEHNQKRQRQLLIQGLVNQNIQSLSARALWRRAHGQETCSFDKMYKVLADEFAEFTVSKRKLQSSDLIKPFLALGMSQNLYIPIEAFDKIHDWFIGMMFGLGSNVF